jgi:Zinc finger, C2H2 type
MEVPNSQTNEHEEAWDEDEDYDEDDEDIDAEAQEIARRLGEELWAAIKANAERNTPSVPNSSVIEAEPQVGASLNEVGAADNALPASASQKEDLAIRTMLAILTLVDNDPLAKSTLVSTCIPNGSNVFEVLKQCTTSGSIAKDIAGPLSQILVTLAGSDTLFGKLKHSNAPAIKLDKNKRKRENFDEGQHLQSIAYKRPHTPDGDLQKQVIEAVQVISQALGTSPLQTLDPSLVSSIRLQLHQVFLFAVTSSAPGGPSMYALQEISGLIQVMGVLSGIQIGQPPESNVHSALPPNSAFPWHNAHSLPLTTDIGTAVYPCLVAGCHKTFSRLYSLRAHQRSHSTHRPFRCSACPASFARNHDLKRHLKLHDKTAWRCEGCNKVFSRRDAIKRHKTGIKNRGAKSEICLVAEVTEVQLDGEDGEDSVREERRAKLWNGIAMNEANDTSSNPQTTNTNAHLLEEGEINPAVIAGIQAAIMSLHGRLQALVGGVLGVPMNQPVSMPTDPSTGQATLASVIARAQSSNLPSSIPVVGAPTPGDETNTPTVNLPAAGENSLPTQTLGENLENNIPFPSLSMYGLSDEQTHLLEIAIANAASAAQAQAEAEAALEEEEEEDYDQDDYDDDESEMELDQEQAAK